MSSLSIRVFDYSGVSIVVIYREITERTDLINLSMCQATTRELRGATRFNNTLYLVESRQAMPLFADLCPSYLGSSGARVGALVMRYQLAAVIIGRKAYLIGRRPFRKEFYSCDWK